MSAKVWNLLLDSFPKILLPGLTMTLPLTVISFALAMVIAVAVALIQFANVKVLRQIFLRSARKKSELICSN